MSERSDTLKSLIQIGQIDEAIQMVRDASDYNEGEGFVFIVLGEEKSTPELVEAALEAFLDTRENYPKKHGYWVHSLSHFTKILWQRRLDDWIRKFNEVSFKGANELHDSNCSSRLVCDFSEFAKFDDDPADFALTPENLLWMEWQEYYAYSKARIEAGRFESEEAFLRWKLRQPEMHTAFDYEAQMKLVNIGLSRSLIGQLQALGADTSEFNGLERDLLTKQLDKLEVELLATKEDWKRERLETGIVKTRAALAELQ